MQTPVYTRYEYVDATSFSKAATQLATNVSMLALAATDDGLVRPDLMTLSHSGLVLTVHLPAPFAIINGGGVLAGAHGTVSNADTSTYSVDFTPVKPGTGSVTAYLIATLTQISQGPYQVVGPPLGHPSYVPGFVPFTAYDTTVDTIALTASLTPADNVTTYELGRYTLTSSTSSLPALNTANQILAAPLPIENAVFVTGNKTLARADAGVIQIGDGSSPTFTLPDVLASQAEIFSATARTSPVTLQVSTGGNLIYGATDDPSSGVASFVIPVGWTVTVVSDGTAWQVTATSGLVGGASYVSINVAGSSNVTLTTAQAAAEIIQLTGAVTGNITILFPTVQSIWCMRNATSGAFTVNAQLATGGTTVGLSAGETLIMATPTNMFPAAQNFPTQANGNSTTLAATTAFVQNVIGALTVVNTFNTRSGAVTLTSGDVTTALGFSPVQSFNTRTGVVTLTSSDVTTALGYTPVNNGSGSIVGSIDQLTVNDAAGTQRRFAIQTAGSTRWRFGGGSSAESGGNAGTDWYLQAFDDTGSSLGNYIVVTRATGTANFSTIPTFSTAAANSGSSLAANTAYADRAATTALNSAEAFATANFLNLTGGQLSGNLAVGDGSGAFNMTVNGAAGSNRDMRWNSAGSIRWIARANATAESGSNVGSDFQIFRFSDAGTSLGAVMTLTRSKGVAAFTSIPTSPTATTSDSSTNLATTAYVQNNLASYLPLAGGTITGALQINTGLTIGNNSGGTVVAINGQTATFRDLQWQTNGNNRWVFRTNNTAEGGGNAGSNFSLIAFDNSGASLGTVYNVTRSTQTLGFTNTPTMPTAAFGDNSTSGATTAYADRLGFGPAPTVHNVTGSRQTNNGGTSTHQFTNSTGKAMYVSVFGNVTAHSTATGNLQLVVDGTTVDLLGTPNLNQATRTSGFVPAGSTYYVNVDTVGMVFSLQGWLETY